MLKEYLKSACIPLLAGFGIKKGQHFALVLTFSTDTSVKNAVVLIREGNGFIVINGLDVRKKIHFNDYDITVSSPEPIKGDYDFYEEEQLRRERYRS